MVVMFGLLGGVNVAVGEGADAASDLRSEAVDEAVEDCPAVGGNRSLRRRWNGRAAR